MLNIVCINVRSLRNKYDEVELILIQNQPDVLILTETWLYMEETSSCTFDGYKGFHSCRETRGGGVSIFILKKYNCEISHEENQNNNNIIFVYLKELNINIAGIYKQPSSCQASFINKLDHLLSIHKKVCCWEMLISTFWTKT